MSLPAFAYHWVGGDISGLESFRSTCTSTASQIDDVDQALTSQVDRVVGDAGWSGSASSSFSTAWGKDSKAGSQVADVWRKIGSIVDDLAQRLASLENQLEQAAYQIEKQGIKINPADGTIMPAEACLTPQATAKDAQLATAYNTVRGEILSQAETARASAASELSELTLSMLPGGTDWGLAAAGLDSARGLWAAPTTYNRELSKTLTEAKANAATTRSAAFKEMIEAKKSYGNAAKLSPETRGNLAETAKELRTTESKLADAPGESALTKLADGDAAGLGAAGLASGAIRGIPYAGALAGGVITTMGDRSEGESWGQSLSDGAVSNGAALAAGIGTAAAIGAGSVAAVAGGVVAGGVIAVGVGDLVHESFQENWSQDIHDHGVVDGLADGAGHVLSNTGKDLLNSGKSIVHGIASLF